MIATSLEDWVALASVYRPVGAALGGAAVVAVMIGWVGPPPWLQIVLLVLLLTIVWLYGIVTWFAITSDDRLT